MYLTDEQFKRMKELLAKAKDGKISEEEAKELAELQALKAAKDGGSGGKQDPSWWKKYQTLVENAANYPFNVIKGMPYATGDRYVRQNLGVRITITRTPGRLVNINDAFNYHMRTLWLQMHRKYRGLGKYQWMDLGNMIWAVSNAFVDVQRAERIYGVLSYYSIRNRSIPKTVLAALGLSTDTEYTGDDIARFRYNLNRLIIKARTLCLPKGMSVLESFSELEGNVFKDSDSERATWYVYDSISRWKYIHTPSSGGVVFSVLRSRTVLNGVGIMNLQTADNFAQTLEAIIWDLNDSFDALLQDEDVARMCSDMLAAFEDGSLITLSEMPEDYVLSFVRNDERTLQLHNTTLVGEQGRFIAVPTDVAQAVKDATGDGSTQAINANTKFCEILWQNQTEGLHFRMAVKPSSGNPDYQEYADDVNNITYIAFGETGGEIEAGFAPNYFEPEGALCDIWKDDVSIDDKIEMTRQMAVINKAKHVNSASMEDVLELVTFSNIVVNSMKFYHLKDDYFVTTTMLKDTAYTAIPGNIPLFSLLSQLDWHPAVHVGMLYEGGWEDVEKLFDLDNFAFIDKNTLSALNDAAMLSGWKLDIVTLTSPK